MGQKNGLHAFGYNSAESEPIFHFSYPNPTLRYVSILCPFCLLPTLSIDMQCRHISTTSRKKKGEMNGLQCYGVLETVLLISIIIIKLFLKQNVHNILHY